MATSNALELPVVTPTVRGTQLLDLSNEMVASILTNLDPPAAVCFALTCKHLMSLVTTLCGRPLTEICNKLDCEYNEPPIILQRHSLSSKNYLMLREVEGAIEHVEEILNYNRICSKWSHNLDGEYVSLIDSLRDSPWLAKSTDDCIRRCHTSCGSRNCEDGPCVICVELNYRDEIRGESRQQLTDAVRKEVEAEFEIRLRTSQSVGNSNADDQHSVGTADGGTGEEEQLDSVEVDGAKTNSTLHTQKHAGEDEDHGSEVDRTEGARSSEESEDASDLGAEEGNDGSQHDIGSVDGDDDDDSSDDDGDSDPDSDGSDDNEEEDEAPPLLDMSNELLTTIICNLDPPSAVCLAFTCRKFYDLVSAVCKCKPSKIVLWLEADESHEIPLRKIENKVLQGLRTMYCPDLELQQQVWQAIISINSVLPSKWYIHEEKYVLSNAANELMRQLFHSPLTEQFQNKCIKRGHKFLAIGDSSECIICNQLYLVRNLNPAAANEIDDGWHVDSHAYDFGDMCCQCIMPHGFCCVEEHRQEQCRAFDER